MRLASFSTLFFFTIFQISFAPKNCSSGSCDSGGGGMPRKYRGFDNVKISHERERTVVNNSLYSRKGGITSVQGNIGGSSSRNVNESHKSREDISNYHVNFHN